MSRRSAQDHTAVWTGTEMIVWGGYQYTMDGCSQEYPEVQGGGRYDPVTDSWQPTTTDGGLSLQPVPAHGGVDRRPR